MTRKSNNGTPNAQTQSNGANPGDGSGNRPLAHLRIGNLRASHWRFEREGRTNDLVTFERSYRDAKGNWQNTGMFGLADLCVLRRLLDRCIAHLESQQTGDGDAPF